MDTIAELVEKRKKFVAKKEQASKGNSAKPPKAKKKSKDAAEALAVTKNEDCEPVLTETKVEPPVTKKVADKKVGKKSAKKAGKDRPVPNKKPKSDPAADVANIPDPTVKLTTNVAPSVEIATELQQAFDFFNNRLFEGKLEPVVFSNCRLKRAEGYFWPAQWARRKELKGKVHEIGLDFARLHGEKDKHVLSVLVHEMCHELVQQIGRSPKKAYHCKYWVAAMQMVGLKPIIMGAKGRPTGKLTGPNSSHEVEPKGKFDVACDGLLTSGFKLSWASEAVVEPEKKPGKKKKAGAKAKHTCPTCSANAWGKPSMILTCVGTTDSRHDPIEMDCDREEYANYGEEDNE